MSTAAEGPPTYLEKSSITNTEFIEKLLVIYAIHLACRGVSNGRNPSNSHLLLLTKDISG